MMLTAQPRQFVIGITAIIAIVILAIALYANKGNLTSKADGGAEGETTAVAYEESVVKINTPASNPIKGKGQQVRYYEVRAPYFCPATKDRPSFRRDIDNIRYTGPSFLDLGITGEFSPGDPINGESGEPQKITLGYHQLLVSDTVLRQREAYIEIPGRTATWEFTDPGSSGSSYTDSRGFGGIQYGPWEEKKVSPCRPCKTPAINSSGEEICAEDEVSDPGGGLE